MGDGLNVAARIQILADAGGICLSGIVYEQIKDKLEFRYEYLGKQTVKNIAEPVRVYQILLDAQAASLVSRWKRTGLNYWKRVHPAINIIISRNRLYRVRFFGHNVGENLTIPDTITMASGDDENPYITIRYSDAQIATGAYAESFDLQPPNVKTIYMD